MEREILSLCRAMGAGEEQEELTLLLVQAVCRQLAARLREGTLPQDCGPAFPLAAAMLVMDRLSRMAKSGGKIASFTAGDLTIRQETGGAGTQLADHAEVLLGPWLRDRGFFFQGVEG